MSWLIKKTRDGVKTSGLILKVFAFQILQFCHRHGLPQTGSYQSPYLEDAMCRRGLMTVLNSNVPTSCRSTVTMGRNSASINSDATRIRRNGMSATDVISTSLERNWGMVGRALEGLDDAVIARQPNDDSNSIAWLMFHMNS